MKPSPNFQPNISFIEHLTSLLGHCVLVKEIATGKFVFITENFAEVCGYQSEELLVDPDQFFKAIHPKDVKSVRKEHREVEEKSASRQHSFRILTPKNQVIWIESTAFPFEIKNKKPQYIAISCKERVNPQYRESALTDVENIARIGGWEWYTDDSSFFCTNEIFNICEIAPYALSGDEAIEYFPENVQNGLLDAVKKASDNFEPFQLELPFVTAKNNQIWIRIIGKPVKTKDKVYKVTGTLQNITKEKQAEIELEKAKRKAEEAARAQEVFLSTMSHEIRTPMNAVIGITYLLLNDNPPEQQLSSLRTLKFSAENLMVLINDILDFNKLESGQFLFEETPFNLRQVAESVKDSILHKAQQKGIKLKLKLDSDIPSNLIGDQTRITQVLNNLVNNAVKFTEEGGVTIDIEVKDSHLEDVDVQFSVSDTGIGIPSEKIENIFKRFIQADPEISRKYGGTGLGLAITKKIVELMGGHITVESTPQKGSIFSFTLGFQKSAETEKHQEQENQMTHNLQEAKILLVEDNKINQLVVRQFLEKWNAKLETADNGREGFNMVNQNRNYDLVLMDLEMPLMNGYETTRKLRAIEEPYFKNLPILALTASVLQNVRNKVRAAGMDDHISKPFHPSEFYQKINFYLKTPEEQENSKGHIPELPNLNRDGLAAVVNGSEEFFDQFLEMTNTSLGEFARAYEICLPEFNIQCLRENTHKLKATLKLIGADALMAEIARGKQIAQDKSTPVLLIDQSVMRVKALSEQLISELKGQKAELIKGVKAL